MVTVDKRKRTAISPENQARFDKLLDAGKISGTSEKLARESEARTGRKVSRDEPEKKKSLIRKFSETKVGKVVTSPKTTVALASVLPVGKAVGAAGKALGFGTKVAKNQLAVISARTSAHRLVRQSLLGSGGKELGKESLVGLGVRTATRNFVGKPPVSKVNKLFGPTRLFATNAKSVGLTKSLISKTWSTVKNPAFIIGAIGSYPFAKFVKEEAIQTLSIPILKAINAGDLETAKRLTEDVDAMIADDGGMLAKIPFANVVARLTDFFKAAEKSNNAWKEIIATQETDLQEKLEEPTFEEERQEQRIIDQELDIKKSEVFRLRREGQFDEADELEQEILNELKGGS